MTITLTTDQRINLCTILNGSRWEFAMIRPVWQIHDMIALSEHEEKAIQLTRQIRDNQEFIGWNPVSAAQLPDGEYELTNRQVGIVKQALRNWTHSAATRKWLEPLLDIFLPSEEE